MGTAGVDFERYWLQKLSNALEQVGDQDLRRQVLAGSEGLTSESERKAVIDWTLQALDRMQRSLSTQACQDVMARCACQYPLENLGAIRARFAQTGSYQQAHQMLEDRFRAFLQTTLGLTETLTQEVLARGWGLAGIRRGNTIVATKIPKSGNLVDYLRETDLSKKRALYCHCPRVRAAIAQGAELPKLYCYCGAGFYKGIWEEIVQAPVGIQVMRSVLQGDNTCTIAIQLP